MKCALEDARAEVVASELCHGSMGSITWGKGALGT